MAKMCLDAGYNFDSMINKTVTLKGLSRRELINGSRGHCGGFDATTGRLDIYLFGVDGTMSKKPILVKINNLVESSSTGGGSATVRLVGFPRRNYATALFGVCIIDSRGETASFLIQNDASIDISCLGGQSPRSLVTRGESWVVLIIAQIEERPIDNVIRKQIAKLEKKAQASTMMHKKSACDFCKRKNETFPCRICAGRWYCRDECIKKYYKDHKAECRSTKKYPSGSSIQR